MATLRQQFLRRLDVTVAATSTTVIDVFGPETALAAPYAENTDHVVRERQVRQNEAGWVTIELPAGLQIADITYDVEIWQRASSAAQKGLEGPLFPSGAAPAADPSLQRVVATGVPGDAAELPAILGGTLGTSSDRDVPMLHVRADEFVRLRAVNAAGAVGPLTLVAKYDLGIHPADTNRLA